MYRKLKVTRFCASVFSSCCLCSSYAMLGKQVLIFVVSVWDVEMMLIYLFVINFLSVCLDKKWDKRICSVCVCYANSDQIEHFLFAIAIWDSTFHFVKLTYHWSWFKSALRSVILLVVNGAWHCFLTFSLWCCRIMHLFQAPDLTVVCF